MRSCLSRLSRLSRFSRLPPCSALPLLFFVAACGTSSSNDSGGTDASVTDANGGGNDSGGLDAGDDASDGSADSALVSCPGTGAACEQCCDNAYPAGAQKFDAITLQCACAADLCGALDGGTDDGGSLDSGSPDGGAMDGGSVDAGSEDASAPIYGVGACTATCNGTAQPNAACNACFRATLGSVSDPGICGTSILSSCVTDPQCEPYFLCVTKCN